MIMMVKHKTTVTPLLPHWSYCSLVLSHLYSDCWKQGWLGNCNSSVMVYRNKLWQYYKMVLQGSFVIIFSSVDYRITATFLFNIQLEWYLTCFIMSRGLDYKVKSMLNLMLINKDFLPWLLIVWWLYCQPIWCQVWKSYLTNMDFNIEIS